MLIAKLRDYYGFPDAEQMEFLNQRLKNIDEEKQDEIAQKIIESCSKRFGFPDISTLAKYIPVVAEKKRKYFWSVCNDCKTEFDYSFRTCPVCEQNNKVSSGYSLKVSEFAPTEKVVRWNIPTEATLPGLVSCKKCSDRDGSYCRNFGNPDWTCSKSDFDYCNCKRCCLAYKKANKELAQKTR